MVPTQIQIDPDSQIKLESPDITKCHYYNYWVKKCYEAYKSLPEYYSDMRPYQWLFPAMYCLRDSNLFAGAMGIGKTLITLITIKALYPDLMTVKRPGRIHIVVPSSTAFVEWKAELDRVLPNSYEIIETNNQQQLLTSDKPIFIYTIHLPKAKSKESCTYISGVLSKVRHPNLLVVDELDAIGKPTTQSYQHLLKVRQSAKRVLGLTGTPAEHPEDIHNFCSFIYRNSWPYLNVREFKNIFVDSHELKSHFINGYEPTEGKKRALAFIKLNKLPDWAALLRKYIHRASLDDPNIKPFLSVPEISDFYPTVEADEKTKDLYFSAVAQSQNKIDRLATDDSRSVEALSLCNSLLKLVNFPPHITSKVEQLETLVAQSNKLLIYTDLRESANYVLDYLNDLKIDTLHLHAELNTAKREDVINEFKTNPDKKALVLSIRIAARALNLTMVDTVIFYCPGWRSNLINQGIRRAARPGNRLANVKVYFPVNNNMIDQHQVNLLAEKARLSLQYLDYQPVDLGGPICQNALKRVLK